MSRLCENAMKTYRYVQNVMELRARIVSMTYSSRSVMVIVVDAMFTKIWAQYSVLSQPLANNTLLS